MADTEIVGLIAADLPADCEQPMRALHEALEQGNSAPAVRRAHTIRGLAGNCNARPLMAAVQEVERLYQAGTMEQALSQRALLASQTAVLMRALRARMAQAQTSRLDPRLRS